MITVESTTSDSSLDDLSHILNLYYRSLTMAVLALALFALLNLTLPLFIVILVFAGTPPHGLFEAGIVSAQFSIILILLLPILAWIAAFHGSRAGWAAARSSALVPPLGVSRRETTLLAALSVVTGLLGYVSTGFVVAAGSVAGDTTAYWGALRVASSVVLVTLAFVALLLVTVANVLERVLRAAPVSGPAVAYRFRRWVTATAGFTLAPGLVFVFGTTVRYPTWLEGWPVFLGLVAAIGSLVGFGAARKALTTWRDSVRATLKNEGTAVALSAPGFEPLGTPLPREPTQNPAAGPMTVQSSTTSHPLTGLPANFDLNADLAMERRGTRSSQGVYFYTYCGAAGFLVAMGVLSFYGFLGGNASTGELLLGLSLVLIVPLALWYRQMRLSFVTSLRVDEGGFTFIRKNGPALQVRWVDPSAKFDVCEYLGDPEKVLPKGDPRRVHRQWVDVFEPQARRVRRETTVPFDAANALVVEAQRQGLSVRSSRVAFWWHPLPKSPGFLDRSEEGALGPDQRLNGRVVRVRGHSYTGSPSD